MGNTTETKRGKGRIAVLALLLALVVAAGLTAAYLFSKTDPVTNEFTFAENIEADLTEPKWDEGDPNDPDGDTRPGRDRARDLVPGARVPKDPQVTNTSANRVSEWVAIGLRFTDGAGRALTDAEAARLLGLISIDWNTADWQLADSSATGAADSAAQAWAYRHEVAPGAATVPLFTQVVVNPTVTPADMDWLRDELGGINIVLQGAAVQYDAFADLAAAAPALLDVLAQA
jgi:hypothetical protein